MSWDTGPAVSAKLYLQLNLYAHERFPHHLAFVRNLLSAYSSVGTSNPAAYRGAAAAYTGSKTRVSTAEFFATLSRTNRLDGELAEVRRTNAAASAGNWARLAKDNPVAARFLAEADIWRSDFEAGTPILGGSGR